MEQQAYFTVMHWLVTIPANSRFQHVPQWAMGNHAYVDLGMSTAAWSPSRRAAVDIAMRLFVVQMRSDIRELTDHASAVDRRVYRAIMLTGMPINSRGDIVSWVRRLALDYRIEHTISLYVRRDHGRGPPSRAHAERLHRGLAEALREDVDSSDEDGHGLSDDQESSEDEV